MERKVGYAMADLSGLLGGNASGLEVVEGMIGPVIIIELNETRVAVEFMGALDRIRIKFGHVACADYNTSGELLSGAISLSGFAELMLTMQAEFYFDMEELRELCSELDVLDLTLKADMRGRGLAVWMLGETERGFVTLGDSFVDYEKLALPGAMLLSNIDDSEVRTGLKCDGESLLLGLGNEETMIAFGMARELATEHLLRKLSKSSVKGFIEQAFTAPF